MTTAGSVVRATSGSVTEIIHRLNLTHDAMERVAEELVTITEPGGHPRKFH